MLERLRAAISYRLLPSETKKQFDMGTFGSTFFTPFRDQSPAKRGTKAILEAYTEMPWLRAVTHKVGHATGTTQWKLYVSRDKKSGKAIRRKKLQTAPFEIRQSLYGKNLTVFSQEEIEDHPLLDLLHDGNQKLLGQSIFQMTQVYLDLVGEAFWILERNALGTPIGIWPLPPHWITEFPSTDFPFYVTNINGAHKEIPVTEIIPFIDPDPVNPYKRGSGTAKSLGDELETDEYAARHTKMFFLNNARPDIMIYGNNLGKNDTKQLEENWLQKHQGFWSKFKPHFMNREVKIHEFGKSFEDMQLVELRKHERDTILQVYGCPPEKFGVNTASNRSTVVAADLFWQKDILKPRIEFIRNTLQKFLVPMFDDKLILDYESPVVDDKETTLSIMRALPAAFTKNEYRALANLESLGDEGDAFILRPGEIQVPLGIAEGIIGVGADELVVDPDLEELPAGPDDDSGDEEDEKMLLGKILRNGNSVEDYERYCRMFDPDSDEIPEDAPELLRMMGEIDVERVQEDVLRNLRKLGGKKKV